MNNESDDDKLEIPTLTRQSDICSEKVDKRAQPKTDKQKKAFEKAQQSNKAYHAKKKKEKEEFELFRIMKAREESAKAPVQISEEKDSSSEEEIVVKKKKITKKIVPLKKKKKAVKIYLSDSSDTDSSSEEEEIQPKKSKRVSRPMQMPIVEEHKIDYRNYFC
jgi:hypothetical protein